VHNDCCRLEHGAPFQQPARREPATLGDISGDNHEILLVANQDHHLEVLDRWASRMPVSRWC
jgi:hypothetical protein